MKSFNCLLYTSNTFFNALKKRPSRGAGGQFAFPSPREDGKQAMEALLRSGKQVSVELACRLVERDSCYCVV